MNITTRRATSPARQIKLAKDALSARLYVNGWSLQPKLDDIAYWGYDCEVLVVAYLGDEPVGVCLLMKSPVCEGPFSMMFVRPRFRRHGIGTRMLKRVLGKQTYFRYGKGTTRTEGFFKQFSGAEKTLRW